MRRFYIYLLLILAILILMPLGLTVGGVDIGAASVFEALKGHADDVTQYIVVENRLPALISALLAGAALAVAGLLMQTCFNNPLAGPSIMGISSGASLGVALVIMLLGSAVGLWGNVATIAGALAGALAVLALLSLISVAVSSGDALLIAGILLGYLTSSAITLLSFFSTDSALHSFVVWGMGSFATVGLQRLPLLALFTVILTAGAFLYARSLNALLMGESFAADVGISVRRVRTGVLVLSGTLTAVVTAWCGPIGFIGLVVPHMARMLFRTSNHTVLIPATALCGALTGLLCQIISVSPVLSKGAAIPVNAITPVIGVPVIIYVLLNRRKLLYFK